MEEPSDETTQEYWTPSMPELQLELELVSGSEPNLKLELKIHLALETALRSVRASAGLN